MPSKSFSLCAYVCSRSVFLKKCCNPQIRVYDRNETSYRIYNAKRLDFELSAHSNRAASRFHCENTNLHPVSLVVSTQDLIFN